VVYKPPDCDGCHSAKARYDGPMGKSATAPWAWMCPASYRTHSTLRLGSGEGQYLVTETEVSATVRDAYEFTRRYRQDRYGIGRDA